MARNNKHSPEQLAALAQTKRKGKKQKGSGSKKYGRNLEKCKLYRLENRREKNKARRAAKLAKRLAKRTS